MSDYAQARAIFPLPLLTLQMAVCSRYMYLFFVAFIGSSNIVRSFILWCKSNQFSIRLVSVYLFYNVFVELGQTHISLSNFTYWYWLPFQLIISFIVTLAAPFDLI